MNNLISVIIPVYKVEKYLRNCIDSVINQSYTNWEMILVDDGSPDQSGTICDEYAKCDQRIKVIHKGNGGLSSARNAGLDYPPKGDLVTFLDSDDFWHEDYLRELLTLQKRYEADIVQCDFVRGTEMFFPKMQNRAIINVFNNHEIFLNDKAKVIMPCKLYKSYLFDNLRMPIGLYNEDDWTTWKIYYRAARIVVTTSKLYYYTSNPTSIMSRLNVKPDFRFFNAYHERIAFFENAKKIDLEHCSRLQFCKALLLTYANRRLKETEIKLLLNEFETNWIKIKRSSYVPLKYKFLFSFFPIQPKIVSRLVSIIRNI